MTPTDTISRKDCLDSWLALLGLSPDHWHVLEGADGGFRLCARNYPVDFWTLFTGTVPTVAESDASAQLIAWAALQPVIPSPVIFALRKVIGEEREWEKLATEAVRQRGTALVVLQGATRLPGPDVAQLVADLADVPHVQLLAWTTSWAEEYIDGSWVGLEAWLRRSRDKTIKDAALVGDPSGAG